MRRRQKNFFTTLLSDKKFQLSIDQKMKLICKYCNSSSCKVIHEIANHEIYKCLKCNLIQTDVNEYESKAVNLDKYDDKYLDSYINVRGSELIGYFTKQVNDIDILKNGSNLLDVGCSVGLFLSTMQKMSKNSWNLYGIDINRRSVSLAKLQVKGQIVCSSILASKYPPKMFDVITCFDVLEHSLNIKKDFDKIYQLLKPEGLLIIQSPNYDSVMRHLAGKDWDWWCIPDHTIHFTVDSMKKILKDNNFIILKLSTYENSQIFIKNIQGHIKKILTKKLYINRIVSKLVSIPLYILWFYMNKLSMNNKNGGLIQVFAIKQ